jgi:PAS domain S-box-containing protein
MTINRERRKDPPSKAIKVLLVEDNPGDVGLMQAMFEGTRSAQFETQVVGRLRDAIASLEEGRPDVILLDLGLPDSFGLNTLEQMLGHTSNVPVIVLTGTSDEELGDLAVSLGAQDYLVKGEVDIFALERSLRYAIQRMKTLEELRESNERYVSLFKKNHAVMFLVDPQTHKVVDVNQAAIDYYGFPSGSFIGMDLGEIAPLEMQGDTREEGMALPPSTGGTFAKHRLADGQVRDIEEMVAPIHLNGQMYLCSIVHDVTDRTRAEEERERLSDEVREQKWLLQNVIENAPVGILVLSGPEMSIKWVNQAFVDIFDQQLVDDIQDKRLDEISFPLPEMNAEIREIIKENIPIERDLEMCAQNGTVRHIHFSAVPLPLKGEGGALAIITDISERVNARKRIEDMAARAELEKRRVQTILDSLPVGVMVADQSGKVIERNVMVDSILGDKLLKLPLSNGPAEFKAWWSDNGLVVRNEDWPLIQSVKKGKTTVGAALDIIRLDGSRGTILNSASPLRDGQGKIIGGVTVLQDITRQRILEHDAIEAKEQAELYIDLLSHDISNMNMAISSYLETAMNKLALEGKHAHLLTEPQEILRDSNHLIENVRKIQQIDSHEVKHSLVDLGWLLEDVRVEYEKFAEAGVKITYQTSIKKFVLANALLKDVFSNLIMNAVKHSDGQVEIDITLSKVFEDGREYYKTAVEDNGPGIPDEQKSKLFQRARKGRSKTKGAGLGLYLVKKVVEDINGRVWLEDRVPGDHTKGTRFVVLLPAVTSDAKPMA